MNGIIKFIPPEYCYNIRHEVLRKGFPIETAKFEEDFSIGSFHLGYFSENILNGIVSCCEKNFIYDIEKQAFQLRGMAVLEQYRGRYIALHLCEKTEEIARILKKEIIWCNARVSAARLYKKLGYEITGDEFNIPTVGPHLLMFKHLD